jgi:SAM-dependent methyltransferase
MSIRSGLRQLAFGYLDRIYQDTVRERYKEQLACLERDPNALLIDLGCHTGVNTARLAGAVGPREVIGLECDATAIRQAAPRGIACVLANAEHPLPFGDGSVDVVTAMDVFEHLSDPRALVREIHRVLRLGGYCVIATPNLASWHNVFALVLGLQPFSGPNLTSMLDADLSVVRALHRDAYGLAPDATAEEMEVASVHRHIVVAAYRSLLRLLAQEGFQVERCRGFGYYPWPALAGRLLSRLDPAHSHHIVLKARKMPAGEGNGAG